jgi:hypothetical protein
MRYLPKAKSIHFSCMSIIQSNQELRYMFRDLELLTSVRSQDEVGWTMYEGVSKSSRTGRLERELQMVQLSATRCSRIAIL